MDCIKTKSTEKTLYTAAVWAKPTWIVILSAYILSDLMLCPIPGEVSSSVNLKDVRHLLVACVRAGKEKHL